MNQLKNRESLEKRVLSLDLSNEPEKRKIQEFVSKFGTGVLESLLTVIELNKQSKLTKIEQFQLDEDEEKIENAIILHDHEIGEHGNGQNEEKIEKKN